MLVTLAITSWVVNRRFASDIIFENFAMEIWVQRRPPSYRGILTVIPALYWSLLKVGGIPPKLLIGTTTAGSLSLE